MKKLRIENIYMVILTIVLGIILVLIKQYNLAARVFITMVLLTILLHVSMGKISKKDFIGIEGKIELCKLRLNRAQTQVVVLISLGLTSIIAPLSMGKLNYLVWIGLIMLIFGSLIERKQVTTRYSLLEKHYSGGEEDISKKITKPTNKNFGSNRKPETGLIIVTILLVFATIGLGVIGFFQYKLLSETSIPNKAELFFNYQRVTGEQIPSYDINYINKGEKKIMLYMANIGRIPSGQIFINRWTDNWLDHEAMNDLLKEERQFELKSGETTNISLPLKISKDINISEVKLGKGKIHFIYECNFCDPTEDEVEVEICLYNSEIKDQNYQFLCKT